MNLTDQKGASRSYSLFKYGRWNETIVIMLMIGSSTFLLSVCHAFLSVHCSLVGTCWERANLLALLSRLVCDVLLCFRHFPVWCPGSCVVLDAILENPKAEANCSFRNYVIF